MNNIKAPAKNYRELILGSLAEVDTQIVLALEFGYINKEDVNMMAEHIQSLRKKLYALINSLPAR